MYPSPFDRRLGYLLRAVAASTCSLLALIVLFLLLRSWPALQDLGGRLFSDASWFPAENPAAGTFGLMPMLAGSLAVTVGAIALALPAAVASAIFCQFYAPTRLAGGYRRLVQLLAGIPSVVFGFWGLTTLTPRIAALQPPGPSLLAGILIVALMVLPTIMLLVEAALEAVPTEQLLAAAALGLGRWTTIRQVVLPMARDGILGASILGTARAIGETMAVVMVCGNIIRTPDSLFAPVRTLTANIALEMGYALGSHRAALFVCGLLLLLLAMLLVSANGLVQRRHSALGAPGTLAHGAPRT